MSVFTDKEIEYLLSQRLGRLATVRPDCTPQVAPVGFRYNAELDVIDIGGRYLSQTRKFRNILENPHVSLVVDDVLRLVLDHVAKRRLVVMRGLRIERNWER